MNANIPDSLSQQIKTLAQKENISIDQLVSMALNAQVSSWMTKDYIAEKAKKGSWENFKKVLDKVADNEPENYDKL